MISLVTGGTGYLGGRLIARLLERGDHVRVLHRPTSDVSRLSGEVELREGDVTDADSVARAGNGCDRIYHTAALVRTWARDPGEFDRANVQGTREVCAAARRIGCRLIYTSTFFAFGPTGPQPVNEDFSRRVQTFCTDYERTKTLANAVVLDEIQGGLNAVVLYPTVIYGPGPLTQGNHVSQMAFDLMRRKLPGIPGDGKQLWTFAYIDDVVEGHIVAAERAPSGGRYILGGPVASVGQVISTLSGLFQVPAPRMHVPIGLLKTIGFFGECSARLTGNPPQVTRGVAETYRHHWAYDSSRAVTELEYAYRPLEEGLAAVAGFLQGFAR